MKKYAMQFNIKSNNYLCLQIYAHFCKKVFDILKMKYSFFYLPKEKKRITLLKSPHVNKKSREQFEIKFLKVLFQINSPIGLNKLNKLLLNKPKVVSVNIKAV